MRTFLRDNIIEIVATLKEGVVQAEKTKDAEARFRLLSQCSHGLQEILGIFAQEFSPTRHGEYAEFFGQLQELLETMNALSEQGEKTDKVHRVLKKALDQLTSELKNDPEVRLEVVFMPYKHSMWDSLESIWRTAKEDPRCDCYVVPIPYYERDHQRKFKELLYEGENYPEEIGAIHYESYDISKRRPDIVYIHNPYDGNNVVTSVHPDYYSYELKKYVGTLVYVPYCLHTSTKDGATNTQIYREITKFVDYAVCQSEFDREIFARNGSDPKKLLPLGNPKLDGTFHMMENPPPLPEAWKEKIQGKKVILFNLSINYILNQNVQYIYRLFEQILGQPEVVLLFRPHPLLKSTFRSMRPGMYTQYLSVLDKLKQAPNAIIDEESEVYPAFYHSDAMISVTSSLVHNYILTEKPVYLLQVNPLRYRPVKNKFNSEFLDIYDSSKAYFPTISEPFMAKWQEVPLNQPRRNFRKEWVEEAGEAKEVWRWDTLPHDDGTTEERLTRVTASFEEKDGAVFRNNQKILRDVRNYNENSSEFGITTLNIQDFLALILSGEDPEKGARMEAFRSRAIHCDGQNGAQIHGYIMSQTK